MDLVPAARTLLVTLDETMTRDRLEPQLRRALDRPRPPEDPVTGRDDTLEIAVVYDGADLDEVAARTGSHPRRGGAAAYRAAATSSRSAASRPASATSSGADAALTVPRRAIAAHHAYRPGSVALAGEFTRRLPAVGRRGAGSWSAAPTAPLLGPGP